MLTVVEYFLQKKRVKLPTKIRLIEVVREKRAWYNIWPFSLVFCYPV